MMNDTAIEIYKLLQKKFPLISKPQSFPSRFISPILLCILSISKWSNITYMSHTLLCPLDIFQNNNLPFKPCVVSFITMGSRENYLCFVLLHSPVFVQRQNGCEVLRRRKREFDQKNTMKNTSDEGLTWTL